MRRALLYLSCLPWDLLVAWPLTVALWALWGEDLRFQRGSLLFNLKADSWPKRTWYARWSGTTFGHAMMLGPTHNLETENHEFRHVDQYEDAMLRSLLLAALIVWWSTLLVAGLVWFSGWALYLVVGWLAAWLRGLDVYRGSLHERDAYGDG